MKITETVFDGLAALDCRTERLHLILVTEVGPRIAWLSFDGGEENLLFWKKDSCTSGEWTLYGGHRVWLTRPLADESQDTYAGDNEPCAVSMGEDWVRAVAPAHPFTKLERGLRIEEQPGACVKVTGFVRNAGSLIYSGGVWTPTCIDPTDRELRIPLGEDDVTWDVVKVVIPRIFAGNEVRLDDEQVTFEGRDLVVRSRGHVTKRCAAAPKGRVEMICPRQKIRFCKTAVWHRDGRYPLDGCNVALFVGENNWMGELETYGRERSIHPGETLEHTETWTLERL